MPSFLHLFQLIRQVESVGHETAEAAVSDCPLVVEQAMVEHAGLASFEGAVLADWERRMEGDWPAVDRLIREVAVQWPNPRVERNS